MEEKLTFVDNLVEYVMFRFRWIFVLLFLMPLNVIYEQYNGIRNWIVFHLHSAPKAHDKKVRAIQKQILEWNKDGRKTLMCTGRPGWMTMSFRQPKYKKTMKNIFTNKLVDILEIDKNEMTVRVEPMVTMGQITAALNPDGWTLPIVPELDDLTVGGMVNGCGVESSSFKHGLFQHICVEYELVTCDGFLITASKHENELLFYSIPWSHGTIGFLVAAKLRIIPCEKYVKLTYTPCNDIETLNNTLESASQDEQNGFVEGIAFSHNSGVVMSGMFALRPENNSLINQIGRYYKPWFYTHVKQFLDGNKTGTEYIPLRDYYHRHSRSIFWELQDIVPFGNNPIFRYVFGWTMPPKIGLLKLTTTPQIKRLYERHHVIQDMLVPYSSLQQSMEVFHQQVNIYPIWLCPFKLPEEPGMLRNKSGEMYVDMGVYGTASRPNYNPRETTRKIEEFVRSVKGFQMLYADTYATKEEFWSMFDSSLYDTIRQRFQCEDAFPNVYGKVCRSARE